MKNLITIFSIALVYTNLLIDSYQHTGLISCVTTAATVGITFILINRY